MMQRQQASVLSEQDKAVFHSLQLSMQQLVLTSKLRAAFTMQPRARQSRSHAISS